MEARVTCITLGVADVDRALRFYEGLGWTAVFRNEQVAFIDLQRRDAQPVHRPG